MTLIEQLKQAGVENPALEARWILSHYGEDFDAIEQAIARRKTGEPLSRILGTREFWGLDFKVTSDVLDPRPDTEILVEQALRWAKQTQKKTLRILDLGCGSGCIVISLLKELPDATACAIDISQAALDVAQHNASMHGVDSKITFVASNWLERVEGVFDLVVSNPPYIRTGVMNDLAESVRCFDPVLALDGGLGGLDAYEKILFSLKRILDCDGRAFLEIGFDQGADISRLVEKSGANLMCIHKDFGGHFRVAEITAGEK